MPTPFPPELLTTFQAMAEVVYAGESYDSVYESLCNAAVELVDGCDHASLMLRRNGRTFTAAASDQTAMAIDKLETELGEGPCLDAIDDDEPDQHLCADLTTGCKWPTLADRILAGSDVQGMAGFRIRQEGHKVGALNVFSDRAGALDGPLARPGADAGRVRLGDPGRARPGRGGHARCAAGWRATARSARRSAC